MESSGDEQQFCLRWNNFQANITSQFETLRDDEDFTDVTIACEGQRLQAHKVVLSACSPYFKELFKNNPCSHPIIFMRDVEAKHVVALMEFMYAGEVNVAQAHLSAFLKTAESLKIRGLTDTTPIKEDLYMKSNLEKSIQGNSTVTSSQDLLAGSSTPPPAAKRQGNPEAESNESDLLKLKELNDAIIANPFENLDICGPKVELPDYLSDEDKEDARNYYLSSINNLTGGMEIIPQNSSKESSTESLLGPIRLRRRKSSDHWVGPYQQARTASPDVISRLVAGHPGDDDKRNRLVKLGEGIEIYEEQLRSVKWSDYRKLTRGLATILFSPAELATCSVTGQRWSRAGNVERPVKPALDRAKVQAIISYVATRFPMIEISRIKQVLAYKCKENSTAFKMKAVRYYGDNHIRDPDKN
ncbi:PREDICTED: zinc finger and BTB domain-containing protein 17 isoform X2 [Nicrophorus vespilloides]|uniref:Zinc finger and BTB domain-containing protein 17 isoform X2 n=1 Tax=Nicrophorus vespilloides TaxID=110193 RepID=A0ABM1MB43_NICVS|nr:PREDICTED: zinc finger and BTB domain-containing protein 17 isoform X2 [Nicrophorus vespilloides]